VGNAANLLLDSLPEADRQAIERNLKRVDLEAQQTLYDLRGVIKEIHFPIDAVISLVIPLSTGEIVETAMVGRDGVVGAAAALNGRASLNCALVQIGGTSLACAVDPLREIMQTHRSVRSLIGAHEQALFAQAQQSAACNATHVIESRLCRWLLRASDLHGSDQLPLTQEYIAHMLGVRRTSVTVVARTLQEAGMIQYRRGHIKLLDVPALREAACECYETVKANYQELLQD
jgi:CRP-like cAMP-binding protein